MIKIGITGGVGSGKSDVLAFLRQEYKAVVLQADKVSHELMEPGKPAYEKIKEIFGEAYLLPDGQIDREKLGNVVFLDKEKLAILNAILHPAVKEEIARRMREEEEKGTKVFVLESALLSIDGYPEMLDEIWYIYTKTETRIVRLMLSRRYSVEKCMEIMSRQPSEEEFRALADVVIDNSGNWRDTMHAIREHCQRQQW
ncbi:MAG: dephospho-CoA kinase [Lachnospiraceae bacterium]|nr:dephospho-CoA kinase [Lachnospiraceae bacterium]